MKSTVLPVVRQRRLWSAAALLMLFFLFFSRTAGAANNPDGDLRIEIFTAYNLVVDSNVLSPSTYAPRVATFGAQFCNDGTATLNDVTAYIGNFDETQEGQPYVAAAHAPGSYPARTQGDPADADDPVDPTRTFNQAHPHLMDGASYQLTHVSGDQPAAQDARRYVGSLAPGSCVAQYWHVTYPRTNDAATEPVWGATNDPDDDLWLKYDIWATASGGTVVANDTRTVTMRNEISAMANKIWPNGNSPYDDLLPIGWSTTNDGTAFRPGETLVMRGVWYELGVVNKGFDNNGDFLPDYNAWLQPIGSAEGFDPGCTRLIGTRALLIVSRSGGQSDLYLEFENQLYFENLPADNNGVVGYVEYEFLAMDGACTNDLTPYQEVASGFDNEKFNADYGYDLPPINTSAPTFDLSKSASPRLLDLSGPPTTIDYTIQFTNTSTATLGAAASGLPLAVRDSIPAGTTYVANSAANGNTAPSGTSGYTLFYSTDNGGSWTTTEPAAASVTDLAWWLDGDMAGGTTGTVTFQVDAAGYSGVIIPNTAELAFGDGPAFVEDSDITLVLGDNSIGDTIFADDGAGGGTSGNGYQDGGESGISGVTVTLYYDSDGDGRGDYEIATDQSDGSGQYLFANLPDGNFVVEVDADSTQIPTGYSNTTPISHAVDLDAAGASGTGVAYLDADFGFGPSLVLNKTLLSGSPAYEGQEVTYRIDVVNTRPGDGSGNPASCVYTTWAALEDATNTGSGPKVWSNIPAAFGPNAFDGQYAYADYAQGSNNIIAGTGFALGDPGSNIVSVEAVFPVYLSQTLVDDAAIAYLFENDASLGTNTFSATTLNTQVGEENAGLLVWDVTALRTWAWADFAGNIDLALEAQKNTNADPGLIHLDAIGFRITTDALCGSTSDTLDPVPLSDTFDAAKLSFLSASLTPSDATTGGTTPYGDTGTLTWDNVGPIYAGGTASIEVTFLALEPVVSGETITNTAAVSGATFVNGRPANDDSDDAATTLEATGTISGVIWSEGSGGTNGWVGTTGYESGTDNFVPGATVTLYGCTDGGGTLLDPAALDSGRTCTSGGQNGNNGTWEIIATATTDASGAYDFGGLLDGYYYVSVDEATLPGTVTQTGDPDVTGGACGGSCDATWTDPAGILSQNGSVLNASDTGDVNFGYDVPPAIYGNVWHDYDADGTQDSGDDGIGSVTVTLYRWNGSAWLSAGTTTTDASGDYAFEDLTPGTYYAAVDGASAPLGADWTNTYDPDGDLNGATEDDAGAAGVISLAAGEISTDNDFGYHQSGSSTIEGTIYGDWNSSSDLDSGDAGLGGITVTLYSASGAAIGTTTTAADGTYSFTNLPDGTYTVSVDPPAQYDQTEDYDTPGAACTICDSQGTVTVSSSGAGTTVSDVDFGYEPDGYGTIGDYVWLDADGDGIQDGGEAPLASITVTLWIDNGSGTYTQVAATSTDADGLYSFDNLPPADYRVIVDSGDADLPQDAWGGTAQPTTATSVDVSLASGATELDADFGFGPAGVIGDTIYWDANRNGDEDWNEEGIAGVTVTLWEDTTGDGTYDTQVASQVTGSDGAYLFTDLPPGDYQVRVDDTTIPGGATLTADPDANGDPCPAAGTMCDHQVNIGISYGTVNLGADFGYQPSGTIGDTIWWDQDGDGVQGSGEIGISGLTVTITNGVDTYTTTTDFDGLYAFDNLPDGVWTVTVEQPAGATPTYDVDGGTATPDTSTAVTISGGSVTATGNSWCAPAADCSLDVDFGFQVSGPHALSGTLCMDGTDQDGVCLGTNGDSGLENITVFLYDGDGQYVGQTTTDANGNYSFGNLPADTYQVSFSTVNPLLSDTTLTTVHPDDTPAATTGLTATGTVIYQTVVVSGNVTDVDFAFVSNTLFDFGDLPSSYNVTTLGSNGPRHVPGDLYLGNTIDAESDGLESSGATGDNADGVNDEDGVVPAGTWAVGTDGGAVSVTVGSGSGYLVGWIDFNQDGDFNDAGEMVIENEPVNSTTGTYLLSFDIPTGTTIGGATFNARFRLFESAPTFPSTAYTGAATNGEVEDYAWSFSPTAITAAALSAGGVAAPLFPLALLGLLLGALGVMTWIRMRAAGRDEREV